MYVGASISGAGQRVGGEGSALLGGRGLDSGALFSFVLYYFFVAWESERLRGASERLFFGSLLLSLLC